MRLPRMTTRRWMVAVAVVGLLCLLEHRRREFASLAAYHGSKSIVRSTRKSGTISGNNGITFTGPEVVTYFDFHGNEMTADGLKAARWHETLAAKYRRAARYPWLPVEPDPPEPN